ncbi:proteoglycan 4-like [Eriocheir sinensis]|uniref:proteoglycan 4-like n=1 Tax=Eriocheir sinensis TaxID=95602 RepID=UPI0021C8E8E8|nr:proteoglycan 4-like [Eriocheir sinensis]
MEYSGPASISAVEADLALSDDEDITDQHWPPMDLNTQCFGPTPWHPQVDVPPSATQPSTSTKRPMDQTSNTSDSSSPAPKSSGHIEPPHPTAPISSPSSHDPHNSSRSHDSRTCPHSTPSQPTSADGASTSKQPSLSTADTSVWKCPRCHEPGVNVWHGCASRSPAAVSVVNALPPALHTSRQAPPPRPRAGATSHSSATTTPESPQVTALREAVAKLTARCTAIEARFEAIDARFAAIEAGMASIRAEQVAAGRTLDMPVESNQALVATVTTFSERLDNIAASFEKLSARFPEDPPRRPPRGSSLTSPPAFRSPKGRLQ